MVKGNKQQVSVESSIVHKPLLLDVQGITFGYDRQPLLYEVCMQVRAGEMVGLLGPNGSGKTTLLRLLSGVLRPQHGKIFVQGRDLQNWGRRNLAQHIAVVPQELQMPFAFTVQHMVSLGRTPFVNFLGSQSKHDQLIVQEAMAVAGITPLVERVFNELSGGERQRVLIAMALAQEPKLLLLDEPTSHLDIKYQIETLELVQRLNKERDVTVIAALHDLNLAARYFPRLILFQRGIVADAGPAEVLEPGLLSRVYDVNVQVGILRGSEHLSVLPSSTAEHDQGGQALPTVHVLAGGGSGELLMRALADAHIPFSAGALNIGDSDHTLALRLASVVITEQPYSSISLAALEQVRNSLAHVHNLVICPMPIGPGNVALLQEAVDAAEHSLSIFLLTAGQPQNTAFSSQKPTMSELMKSQDYTGGAGLKLLTRLEQAGATVVQSVNEVIELLKEQ